jgi:hypothetical protein
VAVSVIRLRPQWRKARCALQAASSGGKSLAGCSAGFSVAADDADSLSVILSEAKLQRSGRSPRGQAFNLRLFSCTNALKEHPEMFRFAQFATGRIRRGGHDRQE